MFHSTHDEGTQIAVRSYTSISHVVRQKCSYSNFGFAHPIEKAICPSGSKAPRLVYAALSVPGPIGLPRSPTRNPQGHQQRNIAIGPCPTTNSYAQTICTVHNAQTSPTAGRHEEGLAAYRYGRPPYCMEAILSAVSRIRVMLGGHLRLNISALILETSHLLQL